MLYLVGIIRRDGGTEGDNEISSKLWMFSANLVIISALDKKYSQAVIKILTFYDRSFVSSISLFQAGTALPVTLAVLMVTKTSLQYLSLSTNR